jgi:hypothetical protein
MCLAVGGLSVLLEGRVDIFVGELGRVNIKLFLISFFFVFELYLYIFTILFL